MTLAETLVWAATETIYITAENEDGVSITYSIRTVGSTVTRVAVESSDSYAAIDATFEGAIKIPSSILYKNRYYNVTAIGSNAFTSCNITSVVIPNTITSIGSGSFMNCTHLTSITIPNSVITIGSSAFEGCYNLLSLSLPESVTTIYDKAFYGCSGLTSMYIPKTITSFGSKPFAGCTGELTLNCDIPSRYPDKYITPVLSDSEFSSIIIDDDVKQIGDYAFYQLTTLHSITFGSGVTSVGSCAFKDCTNLTYVNTTDLSAWCKISFGGDEANPLSFTHCLYCNGILLTDLVIPDEVTSIGAYAFWGCTNLTSVTIPSGVTSINGFAFSGCSNITSVSIPNTVKNLSYDVFQNCSNLTTVTIPNGITSISSRLFDGCSNLTSINIPESVTSIESGAFNNCTALTRVEISNIASWCGITFSNAEANPLLYAHHLFQNNSEIFDIIIPNEVSSINPYAFNGGSSINTIFIPDGVTDIGDYAFKDCSGLTAINIPNTVTTIKSNALYGCTGELTINCNIPNQSSSNYFLKNTNFSSIIVGDAVTSIGGYAFSNLPSIKSITIGKGVTDIGTNAFSGSTGQLIINCDIPDGAGNSIYMLKGAQFSNIVIGNDVQTIGKYAFYNLTSLNTITIGSGVTKIGQNAFLGCSNLNRVNIIDLSAWCGIDFSYNIDNPLYYSKSLFINNTEITDLVIPNGVTNIKPYTFQNCKNIERIYIPESVKEIGSYAFSYCNALNSINISDSVMIIGDYAFSSCNGLTSFTIPRGIKSIGDYAFSYCKGLTSITIPHGIESIGQGVFHKCDNLTSTTIQAVLDVNNYVQLFYSFNSLESLFFTDSESYEAYISFLCTNQSKQLNILYNDTIIKELIIPNSVVDICDNAFGGYDFERIVLSDNVKTIGVAAFKGCKELKEITLSKTLSSIGNSAFENCVVLETVNIPGKLSLFGDNSFSGCSSLKKVIITEGVESIGAYAFKNCSSLDSVAIPNTLKTIGEGAFTSCSSLVSIVLNDSLLSIGKEAFKGCGLTTITLPPFLTSIGESAFGCRNLSTVFVTINKYFPISTSVFSSIKGGAILYTPYTQFEIYNTSYPWRQYFSEAREGEPHKNNIFTLPMPNGSETLDVNVKVTGTEPYEVELVGDGSTAIPSETTGNLVVPSSIVNSDGKTFFIKGLGTDALKGTAITSITIPEGVEYIGENAISQCSELSSIYLPRSLSSIENNFSGCNKLSSFYFNKRIPDEVVVADGIRDNISDQAILYVPAGTKENYVNHAVWGKCLEIIEKGPISAGDITAKYGTQADLPIILNEPTTIMGLQFELSLPRGISVVKSNGLLVASLTDRTSGMIIMGRKNPDAVNSYIFVILSLGGKAITGNEGVIANIRLSIANNIEIGKQDIVIENALLVSNTFSTISSECISEITIKDMTLGDVNNDNEIDIADIIGIVNYILKNPSESFIMGSADINQDGDIDIADVIGVVNIILSNSPNSMAPLRVYQSMLDPE